MRDFDYEEVLQIAPKGFNKTCNTPCYFASTAVIAPFSSYVNVLVQDFAVPPRLFFAVHPVTLSPNGS